MEFCSLATARFEFLRSLTAKDAMGQSSQRTSIPIALEDQANALVKLTLRFVASSRVPRLPKSGKHGAPKLNSISHQARCGET